MMLSTMAMPAAKKAKTWVFQSSWTQEFGFVFLKDRAMSTLCWRMLFAERQVLSVILR